MTLAVVRLFRPMGAFPIVNNQGRRFTTLHIWEPELFS
ncbi:MAG: hypothetical protein K0S45_2067 [Nitrospira sp.]|jgi:hypothetical protein|nr:hypothetical protein [Nitrospira sp.]